MTVFEFPVTARACRWAGHRWSRWSAPEDYPSTAAMPLREVTRQKQTRSCSRCGLVESRQVMVL